jgi:hypothetical protein
VTAGSDELVVTYLGRGTHRQRILDLTGRSNADVARLAQLNGYRFDSSNKPRLVDADGHFIGDPVEPTAAGAMAPPKAAATPTPPTPTAIDAALPHSSIVARGQRSTVKRIKTLADKCADRLEQLYALLEEQDAKDRAAAEAARVSAAAKAEVERLEKQLADAKAKLRPAPKSAPSAAVKSPSALDRAHSKAIREWGQANGFRVGSVGRLKPDLVAAYEAAQQAAG